MSNYEDRVYPAISGTLQYERGDGARIKLEITPAATPAPLPTTVTPTCGSGQPMKASTRVTLPASVVAGLAKGARINPKVKLAGTPVAAPVASRPGGNGGVGDDVVFDHPDVGGKFTVFALLYGPGEQDLKKNPKAVDQFCQMHRRCLDSIITSVPPARIDLRVGSNVLNDKSRAMVDQYVKMGNITKHYCHPENAYKYPVMREMFRDPTLPITTKWLVWFDDDSIADRTPQWLNILAQAIIQHHRTDNAHMFGAPFVWTTTLRQREIMAGRPWYKGRPWRLFNGKPAPNGDRIIFCAGGFWALTMEAMLACDIPDLGTGLTHNGGDWQIGEQLWQGGYGMKAFNSQKQFVQTSSIPRRGVTTPVMGARENIPPREPANLVETPPTPPATPPVQPKQPPRKLPRLIEL